MQLNSIKEIENWIEKNHQINIATGSNYYDLDIKNLLYIVLDKYKDDDIEKTGELQRSIWLGISSRIEKACPIDRIIIMSKGLENTTVIGNSISFFIRDDKKQKKLNCYNLFSDAFIYTEKSEALDKVLELKQKYYETR